MYDYVIKDNILSVQDVCVNYGDNVILRDVNFNVDDIVRPDCTQGQVVALLAPSGMGKTQLFRCISGLKKPDSGQIILHGDGVVEAGKVGVVAQDYPLFDHLTVMENMMLAASVRIKDRATAKAVSEDFLQKFDLFDKRTNYPKAISGGQRQRISILQQMVSCGHILLMDEPFSGLDVLMKERAQKMITDLATADELNTIIVTTHDIPSAIAVADTILLLGRERDTDGKVIPGAKIMFKYNLIDLGLSWRPNMHSLPAFHDLEDDIAEKFKIL